MNVQVVFFCLIFRINVGLKNHNIWMSDKEGAHESPSVLVVRDGERTQS